MLGFLETQISINIDSISFGEYICKSCGASYKGFTDMYMSEPSAADSVGVYLMLQFKSSMFDKCGFCF